MIQKNWESLIKPSLININPVGSSDGETSRHVQIVAEPLERGFGLTLGNALRRILLSSLRGAAVTAVRIDSVLHEFSSISGVREDVTDVILNIKSLALRLHSDAPKRMMLKKQGTGSVKASDIEHDSTIEILNPDQVICTLDKDGAISMELTVGSGKGYVSAEGNRPQEAPIGLIPIDSIYSPVVNVAYKVESTRQGETIDYDKLIMDVETNGSMSPEDAVSLAARILQDQAQVFINFEETAPKPEEKKVVEQGLNAVLLKKVDELELSVRSANCLKNDNIYYIGDLIKKSEREMLRTPNFGRKSLNEIKAVLANMGLKLGMEISEWPPENVDDLARRYEDNY